MKLLSLFTIAIMFSTIALAVDDPIELDSFRIYADGENQNADFGSSDTVEIEQGDTLEMQIRLDNLISTKIDDIHVEATLLDFEGEDILREDDYDLDKNKKKTTVFEWFIPTDTRRDVYELEVLYEYDYNGTAFEHTDTFEVEVIVPFVAAIDPLKVIENLTKIISDKQIESNSLIMGLSGVPNVSLQLSECLPKLVDYQTRERVDNDYKGKYDNLSSSYLTLSTDKATCEAQKSNLYTTQQLDAKFTEGKQQGLSDGTSQNQNQMLMIGVIVAVIFFWNKSKKQTGGKGEGQSLGGATWK